MPNSTQTIPFNFNQTAVRVINQDNNAWFIAQDISDALGYRDANAMTRVLDADEKGTHTVSTLGGNQEMLAISESGLYHALFKSRKPEACAFRKWVTKEVLPSIRKTGSYTTEAIKQLELELQQTSQDLSLIMHSGNTYTTTEIAKELGLKSANALNKLLSQAGVIYKANKTWVLKSRYADKGFTETKSQILHDKSVKYTTQWSEFGRVFLNSFSSNWLTN